MLLPTVERAITEESTPTHTAAKAITSRKSSPVSICGSVTAPAISVRHITGRPHTISSASMAKDSMAFPHTIRKDRVLVTRSSSSVWRSLSPAMAPEVMAGATRMISTNCTMISS